MTHGGYLSTTLESDDGDDNVELRIHYTFRPGSPAVMYQRNGDPGWPEDPDEIELDYVEIATAPQPRSSDWRRVLHGEHRFGQYLQIWAETYLEDHFADVIENVAADAADAAEYRAELRADR